MAWIRYAQSLPSASTKGDIAVYNGTSWVVVAAGADDTVLTADAAQSAGVKWAAGGGAGSGWGALALPGNGPGGSEDDEFDDDSIAAAWTQVTVSGTCTWSEAGDTLTATYANQTAADAAAILKAIPGTPTAPIAISTAVRQIGIAQHQIVGLVFTDGTTSSSASLVGRINYDNGLVMSGGTLTNLQASILQNPGALQRFGPWLHMRLTWVSANTWRLEVSTDGSAWFAYGTDQSFTLSPTHYGLFVSRYGITSTAQASFEYFRAA